LMNVSAPVKLPLPKAPRVPKIKRSASDNEFLAPALEILESPASPVRIWFLRSICALVVISLAWAWFGRIDIIAVAQGKFQPTGRVKVIEPLVTGKVAALKVANGSLVKAGDVLVELDQSENDADYAASNAELVSVSAEIERRKKALSAIKDHKIDAKSAVVWKSDVPNDIQERENQILGAELDQLATTVASLKSQRDQRLVERDKLQDTIKMQKSLVDTLQQRVDMMQKLLNTKVGAKPAVINATESLKLQLTQLAVQEQQLSSLIGGLPVLDHEIEKAMAGFVVENSQKLSDAERLAETTKQRVARSQATIAHMTLRSPISGTVQAMSITNTGQVISSGQEVMRVIPEGSALEIEVYVLNKDIGFVKLNQEAIVKIESFPFTRYGTVTAHVSSIARDAIPQPDANLIEGDPTRAASSTMFAGAQRTQNLVFPVTLVPDATSIQVDGQSVLLSPGMAVGVEFKTGSRRMLEYVFSPLVELTSDSLHER
jgi:hemolysin D